jgi:hypothetical protein
MMLAMVGITEQKGGKYILPMEPSEDDDDSLPEGDEDLRPRWSKGAVHPYNAAYLERVRVQLRANEESSGVRDEDVSITLRSGDQAAHLTHPAYLHECPAEGSA